MSLGILVEIVGDASKLTKSLGGAEKSVKGFGGGLLSTLGPALGVAGVAGLAAGAALAIADFTSAAAEDEQEQQKLTAAIIAAGAATGDYTTVVEDAIAKGQDRAFTDSETRAGLQSLVTATHDVGEATALLSTAQDIARFAGVDLATASDAVAKAHAGNDKALRSLIPGLAKGKNATQTLANAQKAAAGQADAYANSTVGQQARVKDSFSELGETIGGVFLPIVKLIVPALIPVIRILGKVITGAIELLTPLFAGLGDVIAEMSPVFNALSRALGPVVGFLFQLIRAILPILINLTKLVLIPWRLMLTLTLQLVGVLARLVGWFASVIGKVRELLALIPKIELPHIEFPKLPFIGGTAAGGGSAARGRGVGALGAPAFGGGGPTIVVQGALDPEAVARQIRRILEGHAARTGRASGI